jgi:hypothetical protein
MSTTLPRARKAGLVTRKLHDEVCLRPDRHKASCLNRRPGLGQLQRKATVAVRGEA